jgi:hypothetical protein
VLKENYIKRLRTILKSELLSKNKIKAINTWAIPLLTYSFGILKWTETELEDLNRKTRTICTEFRIHHPKSAVERFHLPRKLGGRGVLDIHYLGNKTVNALQKYFIERENRLHQELVKIDKYTPLKLKEKTINQINNTINLKKEKWAAKALHGRYANQICESDIDKENSLQ